MIYQFDKYGTFIREWANIEEILKENPKYTKRTLQRNLNRQEMKSSYNYIWKYDKDNVEKIKERKLIYQYDLDYNLIKIWNSMEEIMKKHPEYKGNYKLNIQNCLNGRSKSAVKFRWSFIELKSKVLIIDETNFLDRHDYNYPNPNIEYWKDIDNDINHKISTFGNVYSKINNIILSTDTQGGYQRVGLDSMFKIHILVAKHFIPNPNNYPIVHHKDEDKTNAYVLNLEWTTHIGNAQAYQQNKKLQEILQFDLNNNLIKEWKNIDEIIKENPDYNKRPLRNACARSNKMHGSFWDKENDKIIQKDFSGKIIHEWNNINEICLKYPKMNRRHFLEFINSRHKLYNFIWKYKDKNNDNNFVHLEPDEEFKPIGIIDGVDLSIYEISNWGKLRNMKTGYFRIPKEHEDGYYCYTFEYKNVETSLQCHRIVALIWVPNNDPVKNIIVNHLDKHRKNNYYKNLEWTTYKGNSIHSMGIKVYQLDPETDKIINTFNSMSEAASAVGLKISASIGMVCRGKAKTAGGYKWKVVE